MSRASDRSRPTSDGRRLRVLHCLWSGGIGGAERSVLQLVREQVRDPNLEPGILFAQASGLYWERARSLGCPVIELDLRGRSVRSTPSVVATMRPYDIHHFHSGEPLLMLASASVRGARRIYTHRGGITRYGPMKRIRYRVTGVLLRTSFHGMAGNTRHAAACGASLFRLPESRFTTVYNGVDFEALRPRRAVEQVRAELGLEPQQFVVGTTANLKAWKRIERIVAAVAELGDVEAIALIVGDGPDRARLEREARRLGVSERVLFAGRQEHVADYLQVMDAFCLASTPLESFGNAAVEAMALGLPTVVFADGGGTVEHIEPGETGYIVGDQAELNKVLRRLADEPGTRKEIGERAAREVRRRYPLERCAGAYRKLYLS